MRKTNISHKTETNKFDANNTGAHTTMNMNTLVAYHGQQELKDKYVARVIEHRKKDEIVQNHGYWQDGKGCAIGCALEVNDSTLDGGIHSLYEKELGIPRILARLQDGIFESLPVERSKIWPQQFLSAITPGADLSGVWPRFAAWLLVDETYGVLQFVKNVDTAHAIKKVAEMYAATADADTDAAYAAADAAAYAAADAAATAANAAYAAYAADAAATAANAAANAAYATAATAADAAYPAYAAYAAANTAAYAATAAADAAYAAYAAANTAAYAAQANAYDAYAADAAATAANAAANFYAAYAADAYDADAVRREKRVEWRIAQADKLLELLASAGQ